MASEERIARVAKGKRPRYFADPAVDKLHAIVMSLVGELSATRDRLDALERLLESGGSPIDVAKARATSAGVSYTPRRCRKYDPFSSPAF